MIPFPPIVVINTIKDFCIFFFRDRNHQAGAPPHFHVVFPVNAEADLVVTIITSHVNEQRQFYLRSGKDAYDALVPVNNDIFSFLNRESVADCNHTELMTKFELAKRIDESKHYEIKVRDIPLFFKKDICVAIRKSPLIAPRVKKLIKEYLKSLG